MAISLAPSREPQSAPWTVFHLVVQDHLLFKQWPWAKVQVSAVRWRCLPFPLGRPLAPAGCNKTVCCSGQNSNRFCSLSPARFALSALSRHLGHWESWIKKSISLVNASTSVICSAGTGCERDLMWSGWQEGLTHREKILSPECQCSLWNPRPSHPVMCHCFG